MSERMVATVRRKKLLQQGRISNKTKLCTMGRVLLQGEEVIQKMWLVSCRGENKLWEEGKKTI